MSSPLLVCPPNQPPSSMETFKRPHDDLDIEFDHHDPASPERTRAVKRMRTGFPLSPSALPHPPLVQPRHARLVESVPQDLEVDVLREVASSPPVACADVENLGVASRVSSVGPISGQLDDPSFVVEKEVLMTIPRTFKSHSESLLEKMKSEGLSRLVMDPALKPPPPFNLQVAPYFPSPMTNCNQFQLVLYTPPVREQLTRIATHDKLPSEGGRKTRDLPFSDSSAESDVADMEF